ncbi:hypothetical protein NQZ68_031780 [Dissostichus eleginoides]|nr:hypothetical protein NQZ68_031780 [Dissostichus eleginoides]
MVLIGPPEIEAHTVACPAAETTGFWICVKNVDKANRVFVEASLLVHALTPERGALGRPQPIAPPRPLSCEDDVLLRSLLLCRHKRLWEKKQEYERWDPLEMCEVTEVLRLRTPSLPPAPPGPPPDAVLLRGWGLFLRARRLGAPRTPSPPE